MAHADFTLRGNVSAVKIDNPITHFQIESDNTIEYYPGKKISTFYYENLKKYDIVKVAPETVDVMPKDEYHAYVSLIIWIHDTYWPMILLVIPIQKTPEQRRLTNRDFLDSKRFSKKNPYGYRYRFCSVCREASKNPYGYFDEKCPGCKICDLCYNTSTSGCSDCAIRCQ